MSVYIRICLAAILVAVIVAPAASDGPTPSKTPWAVLRCTPHGEASTTAPVPSSYANNREQYFKDLFTVAGKGRGGIYDYFGQLSGNIDLLAGTTVYPWVELAEDISVVSQWGWVTAAQPCLDESVSAGVVNPDDLRNPEKTYGLIVIMNTFGGQQGASAVEMTISGQKRTLPLAGFTKATLSPNSVAHEMGHGYGLAHGECTSDPSVEYCDRWDVMGGWGGDPAQFVNPSFNAWVKNYSGGNNPGPGVWVNLGWSGPGINAPHLAYLGWIPSAKTCVLGAGACEFVTTGLEVTLAALGHAETPGVFQVGIPSNIAPLGGYTVEFRRASTCASPSIDPCWDQATPDSVQIHSGWAPTGQSRTLIVDDRGGPLWAPGQMFSDGSVQISIETFNLAANTATIKVRWGSALVLPPPGPIVRGPRACELAGGTWVCGEPLIGHRCGCQF